MIPRSISMLALGTLIALPALASAQDRPPEACGMTEETAQYGPMQPGAVVTLQRHRFVAGDDNWDDAMNRFVGRVARVTRISGIDHAGCPGVRVDVDGGEFFWRARDLGVGTGRQPRPAPRADWLECGQDDARPQYGPVVRGTAVVLGRHRMVRGDDNWADEMSPFVGRTARVVELAGLDSVGCPGVRVDVDGQQWFWRVRDMGIDGAARAEVPEYAASSGVSSDHGRPPTVVAWGAGGAGAGGAGLFGATQPIQECGMTDATVHWGPISVGTPVILGQHREVEGDANWSAEMQPFVGMQTRIQQLSGVDERGCAVVHVEADGGQYFWRARDLTLPP